MVALLVVAAAVVVVVVVVLVLARRRREDSVDSFRSQLDALSPESRKPTVDQVRAADDETQDESTDEATGETDDGARSEDDGDGDR